MQDKYVSLDPKFASSTQLLQDRQAIWQQRYSEASGGPLAKSVGTILGLTTASFAYTFSQNRGFTGFFPLCRRQAGHYTLILGSGFLAYHFFAATIRAVTGDAYQMHYLNSNYYKIIKGEMPFQRPENQ